MARTEYYRLRDEEPDTKNDICVVCGKNFKSRLIIVSGIVKLWQQACCECYEHLKHSHIVVIDYTCMHHCSGCNCQENVFKVENEQIKKEGYLCRNCIMQL